MFPFVAVCALMMGGLATSQEKGTKKTKDDTTTDVTKDVSKLQDELDATQTKLKAVEKAIADAKAEAAEAKKSAAEAMAASEKEHAALKKAADDASAKAAAAMTAADEAKAAAEKAGTGPDLSKAGTYEFESENDDGEMETTTVSVESLYNETIPEAALAGNTGFMLMSSAFVLLMVPGLALFYAGMVRRKNVLATMMQSIGALAVVGVYWMVAGYGLAFGESQFNISLFGETGGVIGWSSDFLFLKGVEADTMTGGITVFNHMVFQGMFAILTPALISGAIAERIRFWPFCIFMILWVTLVYCPLCHMVWSENGIFFKLGVLDFAGGTVVHISAGLAGLACALVLGRRTGYPKYVIHPNSMVLTLVGAGLLWFGWFGFNAGSELAGDAAAASAFAVTQAGAAAAGLGWLIIEWLHKGKPTALGLASGIVAGLVAVTPAAGAVAPWGGLAIGFIASIVCYFMVVGKSACGYDDSLDAFGIHGVGGFVGAILTGVFWVDDGGLIMSGFGDWSQTILQIKAAVFAVVYAFVLSLGLAALVQAMTLGNFRTSKEDEMLGLDQTEHGEAGFEFGNVTATYSADASVPRPALAPKGNGRFALTVDGATGPELMTAWSALCVPADGPTDPDFAAVYPYVTTISGTTFRFRGGSPESTAAHLGKVFAKKLPGKPVQVTRAM